MRRISRQRTTFLITHRLSQIRWADRTLVLRRGELVAEGNHEQLMQSSPDYRRIFAGDRRKRADPGGDGAGGGGGEPGVAGRVLGDAGTGEAVLPAGRKGE